MPLLLLFAGLLSLLAGIACIAYPYVVADGRLVETLLIVGAIAAVGGFILMGVGALLSRLRRIAELLESQSLVRPSPAVEAPRSETGAVGAAAVASIMPEPRIMPKPESPAAASDSAAPFLIGDTAVPEPVERAPPLAAADVGAGAPPRVSAAEWPRVDAADRLVPDRSGSAGKREPELTRTAPLEAGPIAAGVPPQQNEGAQAAPRILKSGVIEGMAYTLYSDGSVDAELPEGARHFDSISAWRAHMREAADKTI